MGNERSWGSRVYSGEVLCERRINKLCVTSLPPSWLAKMPLVIYLGLESENSNPHLPEIALPKGRSLPGLLGEGVGSSPR